jgi:FKBP-type peptidyl-prolyl cis-trans isomerase
MAAGNLKITDIKVGTGPKSANGDLLIVTYTGKLANGTVFDSNDKKDKPPFSIRLGPNANVIEGWRKGLIGMQKGGIRKLVIPSSMAYGPKGRGSIPANAELTFTIKLLDMVRKGEGIYYDKTDIKKGTGKTAAKGDTVKVHYTGKLVNGMEFDSSYKRKEPIEVVIGGPNVLKAFGYGIVGMREGGKRKLRLPPEIAFGPNGKLPTIPGDSVVIFEIELLKVTAKKSK